MSILLIPNGSTFTQVANIAAAKAEFFIQDFQNDLARDIDRRERRAFPQVSAQGQAVITYSFDGYDDAFESFRDAAIDVANNDASFAGGFLDGSELELAQALARSFNRGVRGVRAAFVDEDTGTVLVGTSVIYNDRHFTSDYADPILQEIHEQATDDIGGAFAGGQADPFVAGQGAAPEGFVAVDLIELATIAAALRQRAKPKIGDAIFDRTQGVDTELDDYAARLERQVLAAGGSLNGTRVNAREVADEFIQGAAELAQQAREKLEGGVAYVSKFLRDLGKK